MDVTLARADGAPHIRRTDLPCDDGAVLPRRLRGRHPAPIKNSLALDGLGATTSTRSTWSAPSSCCSCRCSTGCRTGSPGAGCCRAWRCSSREPGAVPAAVRRGQCGVRPGVLRLVRPLRGGAGHAVLHGDAALLRRAQREAGVPAGDRGRLDRRDAGGGITGFFAESVGTPNLLLVAAALIIAFSRRDAVGVGERGRRRAPDARRAAERSAPGGPAGPGGRRLAGRRCGIFANPPRPADRGTVLLTIVVKQLVDFQFNALTRRSSRRVTR
jgi:hypothetical protein